MMRSDLAFSLVVGVLLMLLVVLSRRLCRGGKTTPAATTPPRAKRAPKPFAGLTCKPDCPVCEQKAESYPSAACELCKLLILFDRIFDKLTFHTVSCLVMFCVVRGGPVICGPCSINSAMSRERYLIA